MKAGWEIKQIGEILKLEYGKPLSEVDRNPNGQFPVYGANGEKNRTDKFYFDKPSIIVGRKGSAGEINLTENKFWPLDVTYFVTFDEKKHHINFLYYLLTSCDLTRLAKGVKPGINRNEVYDQKIAIPPLPDQRRIVAILDEAFAGIADAKENAEQNLKNTKEVFASYLESVFNQRGEGWTIKRVSEIADHSLGKMLDKMKNKGINKPYLRNINVRWFEFNLSDLLEMPFLENESERYTVRKGDVLVCEGGYPGRAAIWEEDYQIYFQKALHRVRFHKKGHNKWFIYYLAIQNNNGKLKDHFSGTGIQHFTGQALSKLTVPIPPEVELYKYLSKFDNLSEETKYLESIYQQKLSNLEELKKSLLQQAFSGAL